MAKRKRTMRPPNPREIKGSRGRVGMGRARTRGPVRGRRTYPNRRGG